MDQVRLAAQLGFDVTGGISSTGSRLRIISALSAREVEVEQLIADEGAPRGVTDGNGQRHQPVIQFIFGRGITGSAHLA